MTRYYLVPPWEQIISSLKSFASIATRALYNANSTCARKNIRAEPQTFEQHLWFVFHFTMALWYEILC